MAFLAAALPSATAATALAAESAGLAAASGAAAGGASAAATSALTTAAAGATGVFGAYTVPLSTTLFYGARGLASQFGTQTGLSGLQAAGQLMSAFGRAEAYDGRAAVAQMQGRQRALQQRQQGVEALRRLNESLATVLAKGAAGSVDVLSGSALSLMNQNTKEGATEYNMSLDNADVELSMADYQASQYRQAGDIAMVSGVFEAAGTIGSGMYRDSQLGMPALNVAA